MGGADPIALKETEFPQKLFFLPQDDAEFNFTAMELYQALLPDHIDTVLKIAAGFQLHNEMILKAKISELSGGERKKVFLSLAFAFDSTIMLLDEPTNSLDLSLIHI